MENAKIQKFKRDILGDFQTLCDDQQVFKMENTTNFTRKKYVTLTP